MFARISTVVLYVLLVSTAIATARPNPDDTLRHAGLPCGPHSSEVTSDMSRCMSTHASEHV
ncbi:hypothetical protein M405DRAFT_806283 [Rhizopogon salebrosus TDB-379]|nr:hypothetical protein M405DRAFT_806283 [Rhizopogon salebrosus TDB-379]